ncbi:MAG: phospholipase D-like domain-containing protein [Polyangiaceae bacterium]
MIELIGHATVGSEVRVSMYHFTRVNVAQAFVDASRRGVHVSIILDDQQNGGDGGEDDDDPVDASSLNPAVQLLQSGLPTGEVTLCTRGNGACIGNGINHNKLYLFSALDDGSTNVVVQSSANLSGNRLHNNLVIVRQDDALYAGYKSYFSDLAAQVENLSYYTTVTGDYHTIAYEYPRSDGDTILTILGNVQCTAGVSNIRVTMAFFTAARSAIATSLVNLQNQGCDVRVNMREAGLDSDQSIITTLKNGGVSVGLYPAEHGNDIHSKYLLIDSPYQTTSVSARKLVWTGSHNYTGGALKNNDETLLRIDDGAVFDAFMSNWNAVRSQIP